MSPCQAQFTDKLASTLAGGNNLISLLKDETLMKINSRFNSIIENKRTPDNCKFFLTLFENVLMGVI